MFGTYVCGMFEGIKEDSTGRYPSLQIRVEDKQDGYVRSIAFDRFNKETG